MIVKNNPKAAVAAFIPIYTATQQKMCNDNCNFSFYSPRMVSWKFAGVDLKVDENVIPKLCEQSGKSFSKISVFLDKKQRIQKAYLKSLGEKGIKTFSFEVTTNSPFITGLGSGHPTEVGMILDRNLGVPYIPASSIKGVMRLAYALNIAAGRDIVPDSELEKYFGTTDEQKKQGTEEKRGQLIFLDAYPIETVNLKVDIINPHYGKYYAGANDKQPLETDSPIPVKFLTVAKGTKFVFNCAFIPLNNAVCDPDEIKTMFKTAFEKVGFGGKTAIGYGQFKLK